MLERERGGRRPLRGDTVPLTVAPRYAYNSEADPPGPTYGRLEMDYLWAPWRFQYIQQEKPRGCILCDKPGQDNDRENYILFRGRLNFIMLNAFPYNPGHLLVAPYRHAADLTVLTAGERAEHMDLLC